MRERRVAALPFAQRVSFATGFRASEINRLRVAKVSCNMRQSKLPETAPMSPPRRDPIMNARLQGIACALANIARDQMEPDVAGFALQSFGLTVADLEAAGAEPDDLEPLRGL
mgnify:FL=1